MDLMLEGRRCLVTGASAGIGACIVQALAGEGATVVATARRRDKLDAVAASVHAAGLAMPLVVAGDITDHTDVSRIAAEAAAVAGPIEILVNCAGGSTPASVEAGDDLWEEAYSLNFRAVRRMTAALLPAMRSRRAGA